MPLRGLAPALPAWQRLRSERGQGIIEAAFVVPILLMLAFGTAEMGLFMYQYVQAANCAREAARRAVVRAANAASPPLCVDQSTTVTLNPSGNAYLTAAAGSNLTATATRWHPWIVMGSLIPGFGTGKQITASVTMRMEGQGP